MRDAFREFRKELQRRRDEAAGGQTAGDSGDKEDSVGVFGSDSDGDRDKGGDDGDFLGGWSGRRRPRRTRGGSQWNVGRIWIVLSIVVFVVLPVLTALFSIGVGIWTDAIWYQSVGYAGVFWTRIWSQVGLFALGLLIAFAFLWLNLWGAGRLVKGEGQRRFSLEEFVDRFNFDRYGGFGGPARTQTIHGDEIEIGNLGRPAFWILLGVTGLVALGMGAMFASSWETFQLFAHRVPFGQADPSFGRDIGFYVFELPFYRLLQAYANTLLLLALVLVGIRYVIAIVSGGSMSPAARIHFGVLAMLFLLTIAVGFQLDRYGLVYSGQSGIFQGVSYTDANARFFALNVMTIMAAFAGTLFLFFCATRWWLPLAATIVLWVAAYLTIGWAYPQLKQTLSVVPDQQNSETPYIQNNIAMTRQAFDLNGWQSTTYNVATTVTPSSLANEQPTVQNLRLWDYRPLRPTLENMQLIRNYYSFADVDTDRYTFTDPTICDPNPAPCVRQVMLAGRELDASKVGSLNNGNSSWVNQHLIYTHGIGLVMLPVNEVAQNPSTGQSAVPRLVVRDLPPTWVPGAPAVTQPRIYFGTAASEYVIVGGGGGDREFDYQSSGTQGENFNTWAGNTGIRLDSTFTKILFAARFGDLNMVISNQVSGGSQLLFRRSIQERAQAVAPFLRFDKDPYLVVTKDGRLVYVLDAFTTSDAYPDANSFDPTSDTALNSLDGPPFNYIRNSVKVVMDAYDGTTTFYVADSTDPIIAAWQGVFPGVFRPLSEMSSDLRAHLRYPESYFNAQTAMFERYHVTNTSTFYQGNDLWQVVRDAGSENKGIEWLPLEAYYVEMQVPGQASPGANEFLLLQPMVPVNRPNMVAWVAARNDPENYGKVDVFNFPVNSTIYGPHQMQAFIAASKDISPSLTLWSTQGSTVTMGNLLVVPLQDSILYVEPVYVQSANNPLPVLQKVIVASPGHVVWGDTLAEALQQLISGGGLTPGGSPSPGPGASPGPSASTGPSPSAGPTIPANATAQELIALANQHYQAAQAALRNGDLATYQQEMNTVGQILQQLQALLGTPAPSGH